MDNKFSNWREELLSEDAAFYRRFYNHARELGANDIDEQIESELETENK